MIYIRNIDFIKLQNWINCLNFDLSLQVKLGYGLVDKMSYKLNKSSKFFKKKNSFYIT